MACPDRALKAGPPPTGWIRRLNRYLYPYRWQIRISLFLAVGGQALLALVPLLQQVIIDDAIIAGTKSLELWVSVLVVTGLVTFVAHAVRRYLGSRIAVDLQHDLRVAVHTHVHRLDARRLDQIAAGDLLSRATADLNVIQIFLSQVPLLFANLALLVTALVVMLWLSPVLFLVVALCVPVLAYLTNQLRQQLFPASFSDQLLAGQVASAAEENISGVRVVKAFVQEDEQAERFAARARALFRSRLRTARITARGSSAAQAIPMFGQLGVLAVGGWLAMQGSITVGVFLAFASYLVQLIVPTRLLANMISTTQQARAGAQRVYDLLDTEPTLATPAGAADLPQQPGPIELQNVAFSHGSRPVLTSVNILIERGECVALVGPSGSGKSTVAMLIGRFYDPDTGVVRIAGHDLTEVSLSSVRQAVTVVFDDSYLFSGTISDNIAFGRPGASEEDIEAAARAAAAHEFISELPDGYQTTTGERGYALSGGQRQRIALARAFLADPQILILDDATSAVDSATESDIFSRLEKLMEGRTTILIAHRPSTVNLADRVIVLDEGTVVAQGTRSEVARSSALFSELMSGTSNAKLSASVLVDEPTTAAWPPASDDLPHADDAILARKIAPAAGLSGKQFARLNPRVLEGIRELPELSGEPNPRPGDDRGPFGFGRLLRPFRGALLLCAGLVLLDVGTTISGPLIFRFGIDEGVTADVTRVLWAACAVYFVIQIASWLIAWALQLHTIKTAERVLFVLRTRLFNHLQKLTLEYYDTTRSGRILTRLTTDVEALSQLLQQGLVTALVSLSTCVGVLVVLIALDVRLALAVFALIPLLAIAVAIFMRGSRSAYLQARSRISALTAELAEHITGVRVTQAFGQEETNRSAFERGSLGYRDSRRRSMLYISVFFPFVNLLAILAKAIVLVVGANLIGLGTLSVGVLVAVLLYVDQFFAPMQQLSIVLDQWIQARVSLGQLRGFLTTTPAMSDVDPRLGTVRVDGALRFERVEFAYAGGERTALQGVDLDIPAGQTVALVGTTGAGKSTFAKLALRFYDPSAGRVLIDERPLTDLDPRAFRRHVGYVPQEPQLFTGTIASNIAFGRPEANARDIENAARAVGAHRMISSLPMGYKTAVEHGVSALSAGQRQLVCLARAELIKPRMLVLDEPTANVDLAAEAAVTGALELLRRDRTTLLIAHRLRTAATADRIVVMANGSIAEQGSHDELLAAGGQYARLWQETVSSRLTASA